MTAKLMKIGITGSQGTGKTTLATALADQLNLPLIREQARSVAREMGIKSVKQLKGQVELGARFQWTCLNRQIEAEQTNVGFVSDRTTIDNAVYWLKYHSSYWPSEESNYYYKKAFENAKNYDLVIYVPREIDPEDDGFRSTDPGAQIEIDMYIKAFLALAAPKYITVSGTLDERVDTAIKQIKLYRRKHKSA